MPTILLINPNTSADTTAMMLAAAAPHLPPGVTVRGATAANGAPWIQDEAALDIAAAEVASMDLGGADAVVVAAFADPGAPALRMRTKVPVIGIGEASLRAASYGGRRFGIATNTPGLAAVIETAVRRLRLDQNYTGLRLTTAASHADDALADSVARCIDDGAEAVVIGGGPLSAAAARLGQRLPVPIVEPVPAAIRAVLASLY